MTRLSLKAAMENLPVLLEFLTRSLIEKGFPLRRAGEIEVAAEEALVNIIRYAYRQGEPGDVELRFYEMDRQRLAIEFRDKGGPFDPTSMKEPDTGLSLSDRKIGGLGVLLMKRMVDGLTYRREGEQNILTFSVRRPQGNSAETEGKTPAS